MGYRTIIKNSVLPHRVSVRCELFVPDVYSDENAAPAMGKCASEKNENLEKFVEELWAPQYFRHARSILKTFENSKLPIKFIKGQSWLLTPLWSRNDQLRGVYDRYEDTVIEDIDTTLMPLGETVFGCVIGGKILAVKDNDSVRRAVREAHDIISLNDKKDIEFLLAHAAGNIVKRPDDDVLLKVMSKKSAERFEKIILQLAWSV